jgi:hypothetical protein
MKTIPVQIWSEAPTGPITVTAKEVPQSGTNLTFSWNKATGTNGDVLQLTITVNAVDNTYGGDAFVVEASDGSNKGYWLGFVGQ